MKMNLTLSNSKHQSYILMCKHSNCIIRCILGLVYSKRFLLTVYLRSSTKNYTSYTYVGTENKEKAAGWRINQHPANLIPHFEHNSAFNYS
jgi:hypothetical protein